MKRHLGIVLALSVGGLSSSIGFSCQRQEQPAPDVTRAPDPMFTEGANMKAALQPIRAEDGMSPRLVQREGTFTCPNPPPLILPDEEKCGSVLDGCVAEGEDPVIFRFGHGTRNVGYSRLYTPLVPGNAPACACLGPEPPGCQGTCCLSNYSNDDSVWSCAHGHHHLKDWGVYHLIDNQTKLLVSTAVKYSFLAGYALGPEGGWDDYGGTLPCQFIRIDPNMPAGSYTLAQEVKSPTGSRRSGSSTTRSPSGFPSSVPGQSPSRPSTSRPRGRALASNLATALGSSTPAVISRDNGNDLFYVGSNGHLFGKTKSPASNWTPSSGGTQISPANQTYPLVGGPAAVAMGKGRMEVFARNNNNEIRQHIWTAAAGWSSTTFSQFAAAPPAAVSASRTRALVAWLDADGFLRSRTVPGFPKTATGAQFPTNQRPALAASDHNTYHVFLRAADGTVKYNRYSWATSSWTGWVSLGGSVTGQLSAVSPYYRQALVFARGTDNQLTFLKVEIDPANVDIDFTGWQD